MDSLLPQVLEGYYPLFKLSKDDLDTPTLRQVLARPYKEEFMAAMRSEIKELKEHNTWTVIKRSDVLPDKQVIPGTWALKIKRYPDGRLRKFKGRFCARGDKQVEGVDYFDKWAPIVS